MPPCGRAPLSTYHYRVVAHNADGTSYGKDMEFTARTAVAPLMNTSWGFLNPGFTVSGGSTTLSLSGVKMDRCDWRR